VSDPLLLRVARRSPRAGCAIFGLATTHHIPGFVTTVEILIGIPSFLLRNVELSRCSHVRTDDPQAPNVWCSCSAVLPGPRAAPASSGLHDKVFRRVIERPHGRDCGHRPLDRSCTSTSWRDGRRPPVSGRRLERLTELSSGPNLCDRRISGDGALCSLSKPASSPSATSHSVRRSTGFRYPNACALSSSGHASARRYARRPATPPERARRSPR